MNPLGFQTHGLWHGFQVQLLENQLIPCYWTIGKAKHLTHGSLVTLWPDISAFGVDQLGLNDEQGGKGPISLTYQVKIIYSRAQSY